MSAVAQQSVFLVRVVATALRWLSLVVLALVLRVGSVGARLPKLWVEWLTDVLLLTTKIVALAVALIKQ